ncbi:MAG: glycoside hydrolase family 108 protein [Sphingomicrobium sp.]
MEREGSYANHPADKGGPTCFGITEAVARAHGYRGAMRSLPREEAAAIYARLYWLRPRFDEVARRSERLAAELFDTGVNMGPAVAATFLQRALTALNRNGKDYADLVPDGRIGAATLAALDAFLGARGSSPAVRLGGRDQQRISGETVLLRALEALQGERYLRLAERRPANEAFLYGWLANRIGDP